LKITFLGTGTSQGVPIIMCPCEVCQSVDTHDKRLRSSIMIEVDGQTFIVDTGPDFRQQMLLYKVKNVDAILFTHEHKDHIAGLDDIRAFNYVQQRPVDVYAEKRVQEALKREYAYVFAEFKYPGIPEMNMHLIENKPFEIIHTNITPIRAMHYMLPILGYRIQNFTYITDANFIDNQELEKIKGSELVVINALRRKKHISHYNLEEALAVLDKVKPKRAFLTHVSHQLGFHVEVEKELPEFVRLAYDGLVVEL
jgi:phosphoribosyl 1,2-cyclic phosphate phosphodiesterase